MEQLKEGWGAPERARVLHYFQKGLSFCHRHFKYNGILFSDNHVNELKVQFPKGMRKCIPCENEFISRAWGIHKNQKKRESA